MLPPEARAELEKQHYRIVGEHSAVKTCGWTRNMLTGKGGCYKLKFYGIMSHRCMQMTTSLSCANRCTFCWRGYKAPVSKEWPWGVDEPALILDGSLGAHRILLTGFGGNDKVVDAMFAQAQDVRHVALSLTGEPITYPRINELLRLFDERSISTFLVTNAQYPDAICTLAPVTQLYLSLDAPSKELLKKVDVPLFSDYWERLGESLDCLAGKAQRTCIRLTAVKGLNMTDPEGYAKLILRGDPDFVEIKSYMHVGPSRQRLTREHMPLHEEVVAFAREVLASLPGYELVSEHIPSRVVLLAKSCYKKNGVWRTWIDFGKYRELALSGEPFTSDEYSCETPKASLGISGKGTPTGGKDVVRKISSQSPPSSLGLPDAALRASEEIQETDLD